MKNLNEQVCALTIGSLLHDIGKVIYRSNVIDGRNHSASGVDFMKEITKEEKIIECIQFHHKKDIKNAVIPEDSLAYITYIADNISSGADRREIEGDESGNFFDKSIPLSTVFNILNKHNDNSKYKCKVFNNEINYPIDENPCKIEATVYNSILQDLRHNLKSIEYTNEYINSLCEILETYLSYVPSSTNKSEVADISLYDHQKITAAIACCIYYYLSKQNISNYKTALLQNEVKFYDKKAFIMFSCDFSGIQNFIYNIVSDGALKSLRSRSFYLEMLLEHIIDEILEQCNLSRANLIYSGGGHCYMLMPNTKEVIESLDDFDVIINKWLIENYGTSLYLASAYTKCSGNELMNKPSGQSTYKEIYNRLSRKLSKIKVSRYDSQKVQELNQIEFHKTGRECKICGTTHHLIDNKENKDICKLCNVFNEISSEIIKEDLIIVTSDEKISGSKFLMLPSYNGNSFIYFMDKDRCIDQIKDYKIKRTYSKNKYFTGYRLSTKIWVGDYLADPELENLANAASGIKRLAVLRADVDNLGKAFTSGFSEKYNTLTRSAVLSRQLSLFFKYHINDILRGNFGMDQFLLDNKPLPKKVAIVYSGGDDIFVIGSWDDVIESAIDIKTAFEKFCNNSLTISAGIAIFPSKYPVYNMAYETAILEGESKDVDGKNALTLFTTDEKHIYKWNVFKEKVIEEKLKLLKAFFDKDEQNERGKAFLYKLLELIRASDKDRINIARFAYMLARLEPKKESSLYKEFSKKMYEWILRDDDKKQLVTAIYIYIYLER